MSDVFLDTVGLLALWDSSDQWHKQAVAALDQIGTEVRTLTTSYVLLECGNAAGRRPYRHLVDDLRIQLEAGGKLVSPSESDWRLAWSAYAAMGVGGPGIVDHVSFVVMRRLGTEDVLGNDRHSRAAGFRTLF